MRLSGALIGLVMQGALQHFLLKIMSFEGKTFPTKLAQACFEIFCVSWCRMSYQTVLSLSQTFELFTYIPL